MQQSHRNAWSSWDRDSQSALAAGPQHFQIPSARLVYPRGSLDGRRWTANTLATPADDASGTVAGSSSSSRRRLAPSSVLRKRDKINSLHEQLNELRRQLEAELRVANEPMDDEEQGGAERAQFARLLVQLGSPCSSSADCAKSISNSHCVASNFTCACLDQHVPINSTACLAPSLLGYDCQLDAQCAQKVAHSFCDNGKCACPSGSFVAHRKNKCLAASKLNDYCLSDGQCQLNDRHSFCKWKIPHVYGTCKCPPNYKLVSGGLSSAISAHETATDATLRCAPRLGDSCLSDAECLRTTPNSICQTTAGRPAIGVSARLEISSFFSATWPTSSASAARCNCLPGFRWSASQLECERSALASETPGPSMNRASATAASLLQDSHKYEMIVIPVGREQQQQQESVMGSSSSSDENKPTPDLNRTSQFAKGPAPLDEQLDIKILGQTRATRAPLVVGPTPAPAPNISSAAKATTTTSAPPPRKAAADAGQPNQETGSNWTIGKRRPAVRMSSLGKPCESRLECQARDPHSDCIGGICECQLASSRCRANSTGCHKDTFQCNNGQCISWYFVCDQFANCADGSDESHCKPRSCPPEAFECATDGHCLSRAKLCDGRRDCSDASDEANCAPLNSISGPASQSSENEPRDRVAAGSGGDSAGAWNNGSAPGCHAAAFACRTGGQCLPAYVFCNAASDCLDGSDEDELVCERPRALKKWTQHLQLASAQQAGAELPPAPASQRPDLLRLPARSPSGSAPHSEHATKRAPSSSWTPPNAPEESPLVKTDRASIERLMAALAAANPKPELERGPPSSQRRASKLLASRWLPESSGAGLGRGPKGAPHQRAIRRPPDECPNWAFTCANGKCRSSAILCSGVDGCGDNSDEDRCEVCQCEPPT